MSDNTIWVAPELRSIIQKKDDRIQELETSLRTHTTFLLMMTQVASNYESIEFTPRGEPQINGVRIRTILGSLGSGRSIADTITLYPSLEESDVKDALSFCLRLLDSVLVK